MINVHFYLKTPSTKESLLYLKAYYTKNNKKSAFVYSFGLSIPTKFWDKTKQRVKITNKFDNGKAVNILLNRLASTCEHYYMDTISSATEVNKIDWKNTLNEVVNRPKIDKRDTFFDFFHLFIQERRSSDKHSFGTTKTYITTLNHLKRHQEISKKSSNYDDLNYNWLLSFKDYCYNNQKHSTSYVAKLISNLKVVLNEARNRKLHNNIDYLNFKEGDRLAKKIKKTDISLSEREIDALYLLDLSDNKRLDRVRDLALVSYYTFFRYGDIANFDECEIKERSDKNGDLFYSVRKITKKTNVTVENPLHPRLKQILEKYDYKLPKITSQKGNDYIKEVCRMIGDATDESGLHELFMYNIDKAGVIQQVTEAKYQLVTWHTFRRSAITNYLRSGATLKDAMNAAGQVKMETTLKYDKEKPEEGAKRRGKQDFFH